ncbi:MAG: hypothetical protein IJ243_09065 [Prevotella sp.]|nr:hypothetical protein [Prevotella sp.]
MDAQLTERIGRWLAAGDNRSPDAVVDGARLLLSLNGDRRYYERVLANPVFYASNVAYELGKYHRIRLAGQTADGIRRMLAEEMPVAEEILRTPHDATPATAGKKVPAGSSPRRGRRPDHDSLPEEVKALWDTNVERWKKIKEVYETLKTKEDKPPCDRFDDCQMLADLDKHYRADMRSYDEYQPASDAPVSEAPASDG